MFSANDFRKLRAIEPKNGPVPGLCSSPACGEKCEIEKSPRLDAGSCRLNSLTMRRELTWHELGLRRFGGLLQATQVVGCQCLAANESADSVSVT